MINMNTSLEVGREMVGAKQRRATADSVQACPPASSALHHGQSAYPHGPPHSPYQSSVHPGDPSMNLIPGKAHVYRYHEPEDSPPTRDHRDFLPRAHASPYLLSARDIKSDPDNDTALQPIRYTSSNESFADGLPAAPHVVSHWTHDGSRRPLDSDTMHPVPPRHYPMTFSMHSNRPPSEDYPRYSPIQVQQRPHYEPSHHGQAQAAPSPEESHPVTTHMVTKRKILRATQACDSCRQLKAKCDERKPCTNCKDRAIECKYRESSAKQHDRVGAEVLRAFKRIQDQISGDLIEMGHRIERMENGMDKRMKILESGMTNLERKIRARSEAREAEDEEYTPYCNYSLDRTMNEKPAMTDEVQKTLREANEIEIEANPGAPVEPGSPMMPANHTTLAGLLLKWPSIIELVGPILEQEGIYSAEEFPTHQEQQRGLFRVHGRGKGLDIEIYSSLKSPSLDSPITDVNQDFADASAFLPGKLWGQVGSVSEESTPDFDPRKVKAYVQSFKDNILTMHPILVPGELDALVAIFLQSLLPKLDAQQPTSNQSVGAQFVVRSSTRVRTATTERGTKRKLSAAVGGQPPGSLHRPTLPSRTIQSALVLSVLALGKICLHRGKIPDMVPETDQPVQWSPPVLRGQGLPPGKTLQPPLSGRPSPKEHGKDRTSRWSSHQGSEPYAKPNLMKRNVEQIPGLEYFALATDIIGSHIGGTTLNHVHTWLFIGLYYGQLGRVIESWGHISNACRTLAVCLRTSQERLVQHMSSGKDLERKRDNQLVFAYWSCLQLECDILAELRLPLSPLLNFEKQMPYPNLRMVVGYPDSVMLSYAAQLYLRKQLNLIHSMLYDSKTLQSRKESLEETIQTRQISLAHSRETWVPPEYQWDDEDPPADNNLAARLRAKYWGSQVILYRPYLDVVLHPEKSTYGLFAAQPVDPLEDSQINLSKYPVPPNMDQYTWPRALTYARRGIRALVESTQAFHGLDPTKRIIVTNPFTTAHAQWGNLLCLAACWRHPILCQMLDKNTLAKLFTHTIKLFHFIVTRSSALNTELDMLMKVHEMLNLGMDDHA